jgi:hypothetical protein
MNAPGSTSTSGRTEPRAHRRKAVPRGLKIVYGGQTGVDRAALDWAIEHDAPHGGWCPQGRLAEDGAIPARYRLRETPEPDYAQRTVWNVRDSDGTVIFSAEPALRGGSQFTAEIARELGKPLLHLHGRLSAVEAAKDLARFQRRRRILVLNIAGPRASQEPNAAAWVDQVLTLAWAGDAEA